MEFYEPWYQDGKDFNHLRDMVVRLGRTNHSAICDALVIRAGRPYYKVWPEYVDLFMKTKLDAIPSSEFRLPFPAIEIRLSKPVAYGTCGHNLVAVQLAFFSGKSPSAMVTNAAPCDMKHATGVVINASYVSETQDGQMAYTVRLDPCDQEKSIEEIIQSAAGDFVVVTSPRPNPDEEEMRRRLAAVFRLAVSLAFIATGQYHFVNPDVINADISKLWEAVGRGDQVTIDKLADRAARRRQGSRGFTVGKFHAINIPRQSSSGSVVGECEVARELRHQHMRSAHWRVQRIGVGRTQYKVVFIAPTIVRPDLPVSSSQQDRRVH